MLVPPPPLLGFERVCYCGLFMVCIFTFPLPPHSWKTPKSFVPWIKSRSMLSSSFSFGCNNVPSLNVQNFERKSVFLIDYFHYK